MQVVQAFVRLRIEAIQPGDKLLCVIEQQRLHLVEAVRGLARSAVHREDPVDLHEADFLAKHRRELIVLIHIDAAVDQLLRIRNRLMRKLMVEEIMEPAVKLMRQRRLSAPAGKAEAGFRVCMLAQPGEVILLPGEIRRAAVDHRRVQARTLMRVVPGAVIPVEVP